MTLRTEYIDIDFKLQLKKDLQEDEIICPSCSGSGLQVGDNPFGLVSDKDKYKEMFPHKKQTIISCQRCYNGVQKVCEYCNKPLGRRNQCDCEGSKEARANKWFEQDMARWNKANKTTVSELLQSDYSNMIYFHNDEYFGDIDDLLHHLQENYSKEELTNMQIIAYKTTPSVISLDANYILETATDELHEDAYENISKEFTNRLQVVLNEFAKEIEQETRTYYPDYTQGIIITVDDIFKIKG